VRSRHIHMLGSGAYSSYDFGPILQHHYRRVLPGGILPNKLDIPDPDYACGLQDVRGREVVDERGCQDTLVRECFQGSEVEDRSPYTHWFLPIL
jgi:hypothetical protein